jgi:SSS family solute:Na+ symporter
MHLAWIDYAIMVVYLAFVLGIGFALKRVMKSSTDFFLSGRSIPAWITGLAFISANLGAQEVIGMGASGAKYGILTSHFYWIGAIPAMVFVGIFMMPFYYGSKARSVPEYLKFRFDEKTRGFNAISFACMTVFSSGISMFAMGKLFQLLLGWDLNFSIWLSAAIVLCYIFLGGLTSAIYNEVLQFFLIVFGFLPLTLLGLKNVGGWSGLKSSLAAVAVGRGLAPDAMTSSWRYMDSPAHNPVGVEWFGMAMGLGFVLSFAYWCTDFLVVQRAMAADSMSAARRTPLIASFPKMLFPFLVILPGMVALVATLNIKPTESAPNSKLIQRLQLGHQGIIPVDVEEKTIDGKKIEVAKVDEEGRPVYDYNNATPMMLINFFPSGLLGLGLAALMASFMSGMAGNVTAFNTVWTYDIYQGYINKHASDHHYLWMGRFTTVWGIVLSVAAAYLATRFNNIMDALQLVFSYVNAPLLATFLLGMFWARTTGHGAFTGLLSGTLAAFVHHGLSLPEGAKAFTIKGGFLGSVLHRYPSEMAQNFWGAIWAFGVCFGVTIIVSLLTRSRPAEELKGLVYSLTPKIKEYGVPWYKQPAALGIVVLVAAVILNIIFW